jgi:hypothetical protein
VKKVFSLLLVLNYLDVDPYRKPVHTNEVKGTMFYFLHTNLLIVSRANSLNQKPELQYGNNPKTLTRDDIKYILTLSHPVPSSQWIGYSALHAHLPIPLSSNVVTQNIITSTRREMRKETK